MSKPKTPGDAGNEDVETPSNSHGDDVETPSAFDEIEAALAGLVEDGAQVTLFECDKGTRNYLDTWAANEFTMERLADTYGGGTYFLQFKRPDKKFAKGVTVRVHESRKRKVNPASPEIAFPATPDLQAKILERLERLEKPAPASGVETAVKLIAALTPILSPVVLAMVQRPPKEAINEMLLAHALKEGSRRERGESDPVKTIEAYERLKQHFGREPGSEDEKNVWLELADKFAPILQGLVQKLAAPRPATPPGNVVAMPQRFPKSLPTASPADDAGTAAAEKSSPPPATSAAAASPAPSEAELRGLRLAELTLTTAELGGEVETFADLLADTLTGQEFAQLEMALSLPNWFEILFAAHPRAAAVRPWLERLRETITNPPEETTTQKPATA